MFSWSIKLGRIFGIPFYLHWTFLILIAFVLLQSWAAHGDLREAFQAVVFILSLFGCVLLHELGHALAARRYGIPTEDITLMIIGGVARLRKMPENPLHELVVALAGPAVNLVIALVLIFSGLGVRIERDDHLHVSEIVFNNGPLGYLLIANVMLMIFNLIPAFPMDGGRVLRALLAMTMDYPKATRTAASIGQLFAIGFGFLGLYVGAPLLLLVALFVWISAGAEAYQVEERYATRDVSIGEAMLTDFVVLPPSATLGEAAEQLLAGSQQDFPIGHGPDAIVGVLPRSRLLEGLARLGPRALVTEAMTPGIEVVEMNGPLLPAMNRLREHGLACMQVRHQGRSVGLLTLENIAELMMIRAALEASRRI
ncbi:peptidase M50 [Isosphaera pallida ATCC 43644]|jgi:Zn-dependent protease|uniref:Zinc metalloprotease n=1 Tax=Isosphaera pallida (strain ATCC 43644 / DSM 9630 / IS1B) TaxID=575540 RepID=E8QZZ2_ISOPI|nr:site-2 protease family protein [Isosphaera pallida]ADV64268.1 peptidase M50 [Isosphaera pallida ATCC 43644]